jgi:S1-C subfamily serine protease
MQLRDSNVRRFIPAHASHAVGRLVRRFVPGSVSRACAIALGILAASAAHAGVPLPVLGDAAGSSVAAMLKEVAPAVVGIEVAGRAAAQHTPARNGNISSRGESSASVIGSGVVFDARRGLVVTSSHVVDGTDTIMVKLGDGRALPAQRVGVDPETGVAVIRVEAVGLTALAFGDSDSLEVGDFVFAIGNPARFGHTLTAGIVSGLHRSNVGLEEYEDFIQTDAAIGPGHPGGALVNLRGDLVGINIATKGIGRSNTGFGFATPVNMARALVDRMLESGDIHRGELGLTFDDPARTLVSDLKLSVPPTGAVVLKVDARSAAERAGLKAGDVVTRLGGTPVRDASELSLRIAMLRIGEVAEFGVSRRGDMLTLHAAPAVRAPRVHEMMTAPPSKRAPALVSSSPNNSRS